VTVIVETRMRGGEEILAGLRRVRRALEGGATANLGHRLTRETLRIVKQLTPRQRNTVRHPVWTKRGHEPIWKQWESVERRIHASHFEAVVRNRAQDTEGMVILAALEAGAGPHSFGPTRPDRFARMFWLVNSSFRRFSGRSASPSGNIEDTFERESNDPGVAVARRVNHPGHAGFHMVEETVKQMNRLKTLMMASFARQIERNFVGLDVSIGARG
jgi:hypothetical protein